MTKLRKQRRRKVFRHNVNRKRMRNKIFGVGNIGCKEVKNAWENKKSIETNLIEMGLSYDPNKTIKIPKSKTELKAFLKSNKGEWNETQIEEMDMPTRPDKKQVVTILEEEAKAPRQRKIRLPNSIVEWVTYLMNKYGNDFKAMERDKKNYNQETWKQIRQKIRRFLSIPEQCNKYKEDINFSVFDFSEHISDDEL
ncbi:unnamed protein product [Phaedon cochleariae]|uniref:Nucleolar protein 16 n=1 Tax=Phaedon cochleariae TaxID=80249 RepID=A0A9N9SGH1_PHACE|nr:unnamed protein product [Phaedon cochleariae]